MVVLVTGGSGSGKSAFAEEYLMRLSTQAETKYYIATMQPFGEESLAKIRRHQRLRAGKGFTTIEQSRDLTKAAQRIAKPSNQFQEEAVTVNPPENSVPFIRDTALLECMSNLVANEMFAENKIRLRDEVTAQILDGIEALNSQLAHFLIVTNNVFEDGIVYDTSTMEYLRALGSINVRLAERSDAVVEVIAGIPVARKGKLPAAAAEKQGHRQKGAPACP